MNMELAQYQYEMYLATSIAEQASMERYVNECLQLSESNISVEKVFTLNENLAEKVKTGFTKLMNTIVKIWNKFLENMNTLVKSDKGYLEKYKDVIIKKQLKDVKYTMYNYQDGLKKLNSCEIPAFNYNIMKDHLVDKNTFINSQISFKNIASTNKTKEEPNMLDLAKTVFRGGPDTEAISSEQLNMTDIFNYCYNYKDTAKLIEKDITYIQKAGSDAISLIDKMVREKKIKNESNLFNNTFYSVVYEQMLNEVEIENGDSSQGSTPNVSSSTDNDPSKSYNKINKDKDVKMKEKDISSDDVAKEISDKVNVYLKVCGDVLAAKQSIAEEAYKEYMSIIKYHVRELIGNKDKDNTKVKDTSSNQTDDSINKEKDKEKPVEANRV